MEVVQYIGGCSVHRGITSVLWGDNFSTVGDSFSTVEVVQYSEGIGFHQYCGGIPSVLWGNNSSTYGGIPSVLWRLFSIVGDNISTVGG